ncbi:MAG: hypothetical protein ACW99R_10855 [Candidatus Hodarchaeales archaeon]
MTSTHLCLLLFAQDTWNQSERQIIKSLIHKMLNSRQASFLIGTTNLKNERCAVCSQIFDSMKEIQGVNDGRLFISHNILDTFYIWDSDHRNEVIDFINQILTERSIKKVYILQIGSFKATLAHLKKFNLNANLTRQKFHKKDFIELLSKDKFENNVIYEIGKDSY